jgi:hypothetical protein
MKNTKELKDLLSECYKSIVKDHSLVTDPVQRDYPDLNDPTIFDVPLFFKKQW